MVTPRLVTASRRLAAALPSACALLFVAPPALAQATDPQDPTNPDSAGHNVPDKPRPADEPDRTPKLEFRAKGELTFQSDLDEGGGDVQVWRAGAGAGYGFWIGEQLRLKVDLDAEHSAYQFDGATGLVPGPAGAPGPGDPFDDFVSVALIPSATFFLSRDLGLFAGGGPEYSAEAGVDLA
ncbi:MAG TPA: hypothetical protein VD963_10345, partial [Phycisphaerales bacterium]|nr:hypothetical protein [Phycisphaerales bacterium]